MVRGSAVAATDPGYAAARRAAADSLSGGGIPIGSALMAGQTVIATGHNQRVQRLQFGKGPSFVARSDDFTLPYARATGVAPQPQSPYIERERLLT